MSIAKPIHDLDWAFLHGEPCTTAVLKSNPADFQVTESLSFEPTGEGEHLYLFVQKTGLNTAFVAQELAKQAGIHPKAVAFAGRKDKQAVTRQWFSLHLPGKANSQLPEFGLEACRILEHTRHQRKLQTGAVKHNRFSITLRDVKPGKEFDARLAEIKKAGVPNYFGLQRFGIRYDDGRYSNLKSAEMLLTGETIRKREKRSMAISALRAWLFNQFVSARIKAGTANTPQAGDLMSLAGSASFFACSEIDQDIQSRVQQRDIFLTAPMWGAGQLKSGASTLAFEQEVAAQYQEVCQTLEGLGLRQERRPILTFPEQLTVFHEKDQLKLEFNLAKGCFATSVIRELAQTE